MRGRLTSLAALSALVLAIVGTCDGRQPAFAEAELQGEAVPEVLATAARITPPSDAVTTKPAVALLHLDVPQGCYDIKVEVDHPHEFEHIVVPRLTPKTDDCLEPKGFDFSAVDLGRLAVGEHELRVENAVETGNPVFFTVRSE